MKYFIALLLLASTILADDYTECMRKSMTTLHMRECTHTENRRVQTELDTLLVHLNKIHKDQTSWIKALK